MVHCSDNPRVFLQTLSLMGKNPGVFLEISQCFSTNLGF